MNSFNDFVKQSEMHKKILQYLATENVVHEAIVLVSLECLLEMQTLGPSPELLSQNLHANKAPVDSWAC